MKGKLCFKEGFGLQTLRPAILVLRTELFTNHVQSLKSKFNLIIKINK